MLFVYMLNPRAYAKRFLMIMILPKALFVFYIWWFVLANVANAQSYDAYVCTDLDVTLGVGSNQADRDQLAYDLSSTTFVWAPMNCNQ